MYGKPLGEFGELMDEDAVASSSRKKPRSRERGIGESRFDVQVEGRMRKKMKTPTLAEAGVFWRSEA